MKKHSIIVIFIFLSFIVVLAGRHKARDMLSLHLIISGDSISLEKITSYKGNTKKAHTPHQNIIYECFNNSDSLVYTGEISDPRIVHYDFKDPNKQRKMKGGSIKREKASFSLRIPADLGIQTIRFHKKSYSQCNNPEKSENGKFLGKISISEKEK